MGGWHISESAVQSAIWIAVLLKRETGYENATFCKVSTYQSGL